MKNSAYKKLIFCIALAVALGVFLYSGEALAGVYTYIDGYVTCNGTGLSGGITMYLTDGDDTVPFVNEIFYLLIKNF